MIVAAAIGRAFPTTGFFLGRNRRYSFSSSSFKSILSMTKIDYNRNDPDPTVKLLEPEDLRRYYEETKRIILDHGRRKRTGGDPARATTLESAQSSMASISFKEKSMKPTENSAAPIAKAFSLQHFEPRHRRSMMRCVLNQFDSYDSINEKPVSIMTKAEFQQRLRNVDRTRRWKMTRLLLFGVSFFDGSHSDIQHQKHWWESDTIPEENAPGLAQEIQAYKDSWAHNEAPTEQQRVVDEEKVDPKKFLSRLAKGRTYKGSFRSLLDDYVVATDEIEKERLISLYERITDGGESAKLSWEETNQREVELLHSFIDELEEEGDDSSSVTEPSVPVRSSDQISLLRSICDLDIFTSAPPSRSMLSSNGGPIIDDGGRSMGKKGEQDLETFLQQRLINGATNSSELSPNATILSPVWVRPKDKNRRNIKQKCRYVLEIPRSQDAKNGKSTGNGKNSFTSQGTTSEFDAMVTRVIQSDIHDGSNSQMLPIMVIEEVWEAKATLDPSALMDALDKKARSLQKILCDEKAHVLNLSSSNYSTSKDFRSMDESTNEGANFVILPLLEPKKKVTSAPESIAANPPMPKVYRVGIEPGKNCGSNQSIPQIGVFATRMIGPGAAARRIQTIVYEKMLESDLTTVKGVARRGHGDVCDEEMDSHCNRLVRDRSVEIIERILGLIDTLRPIVVVEI